MTTEPPTRHEPTNLDRKIVCDALGELADDGWVNPDRACRAHDIKSRIESGEWVLVAAVPVPPRIIEHTHAVGTGSTGFYPWCPACGTATQPDPDHAAPRRSTKHRDPEWSE